MASVDAEDIAISERLARLAEDARAESAGPRAAAPRGAELTAHDAADREAPDRETPGSVSLGWILDSLHERAFGLFLLILALPCCIPFLYGVPQAVALPMAFVSAQITAGRRAPWLTERLRARQVPAARLDELARRAAPWLRRVEAVSRPRLAALTRPPADRIIGLALLLFSASILVPLPGTNTVPGIAVAVVAMGLLQRDGALAAIGVVLGVVWILTLLLAGATLATLLGVWLGLGGAG
ncbi:MAG: exopolysaccharide biosynthesis protein [Pseudomonadota bacterium]